METNYYFDVSDNIKKLIIECLDELKALNVPIPISVYFREGGGTNIYGLCYEGKYYKKYSNWDFVISINKYLTTNKDLKETIIHELLHTLDLNMTHTGEWKFWANYVNQNTNYNITRTSNFVLKENTFYGQKYYETYDKNNVITLFCPICKDSFQTRKSTHIYKTGASDYYCRKCNINYYKNVPDSPIKNYTDAQKLDFIDSILFNESNFEQSIILNVLPYLNQALRNKLILKLFLNKTELFLSPKTKWDIVYPILNTCDRKTKTSIADMYINNQVDRLKYMTEREFIEFSALFSLTKDFTRIQDHWVSLGNERI